MGWKRTYDINQRPKDKSVQGESGERDPSPRSPHHKSGGKHDDLVEPPDGTDPARRQGYLKVGLLEGEPRAPGPAVWSCTGDSGRGTDAGEGNQSVSVSQSARQAARGEATAPDAREAQDRGRAPRVSLQLPRLGGRGDESSARGHRSGPRTCGPEQGRGSLSVHGPIRPPTSAHGRLGKLPSRRASRTGGRAEPPMTHRPLDTRRSATASADTAHLPGA